MPMALEAGLTAKLFRAGARNDFANHVELTLHSLASALCDSEPILIDLPNDESIIMRLLTAETR